MQRIARVLVSFIALAWPAAGAFAHAMLDHASPAVGSTVSPAPKSLTLTYSEKLEPAFSSVAVRNAQGASVTAGKASVSGTQMRVPLKALPPGTYTVIWHALSVDTHRTQGDFSFSVGKQSDK
jgi:methionine-rich copper-binding protein CopC